LYILVGRKEKKYLSTPFKEKKGKRSWAREKVSRSEQTLKVFIANVQVLKGGKKGVCLRGVRP